MKLTHYFNGLTFEEKYNLISSVCNIENVYTSLTDEEIDKFIGEHYDEFSELLYDYLEDLIDVEDVDDAYTSSIMWFNKTNFATKLKHILT